MFTPEQKNTKIESIAQNLINLKNNIKLHQMIDAHQTFHHFGYKKQSSDKTIDALFKAFLENPDPKTNDQKKPYAKMMRIAFAYLKKNCSPILDQYVALNQNDRSTIKKRIDELIEAGRVARKSPQTEPSASPPTPIMHIRKSPTFKEAYNALNKKLSLAQTLYVNTHLREKQLESLDAITNAWTQKKIDDQAYYTVLTLMHKNMDKEFRWTRLLGLPRQSRLNDVIRKKIVMFSEEFPNIQPLNNKRALLAMLEAQTLKPDATINELQKTKESIQQLLKPHSFLDAAQAFIKNGLHMFHKPKPKSEPTHKPKSKPKP